MIAFRDALCITHNPVNGTVSQGREGPARFAGCRITLRTPVGIIRKAALWEERFNEKLGKAIFCKDLYTDPETGAEIRLLRYPAGLVNPAHTHPCGLGLGPGTGKARDGGPGRSATVSGVRNRAWLRLNEAPRQSASTDA
jgi:hypothetical protein